MSVETLQRKLVALRMLEKVKRHEKSMTQNIYAKDRAQFEKLVNDKLSIEKLIMATESEMHSSSGLNQLSQHAVDAKMHYLEELFSLQATNIASQRQLSEKISQLETQLLKCSAEQRLVEDLYQSKHHLVRLEIAKRLEEK